MDRIGIDEIERMVRTAAKEHHLPLQVVGASFDGGSDYVELVVNVDGCVLPPCRFSIAVFRNESARAIYRDIAELLERHVAARPPPDSTVTFTAARDRRSQRPLDDEAD